MDILPAGPAGYRAWAQYYYEIALSLAYVEAVFRHEPMIDALSMRLNPTVDMASLRESLEEIGYS